jgi:RNA polymerase sigma-70 factor (ECF subfamily)
MPSVDCRGVACYTLATFLSPVTITVSPSLLQFIMTVKEYNRSVEEYADPVYRFIRGNLKDEERANDIVQDSYEKLWRHVAEIEYTVVKSWLFSTAYNNMIDIIRKEKRITLLNRMKMNYLDSQYSDLNEILHLARTVAGDPKSLILRDYEGYSYKEIGELPD